MTKETNIALRQGSGQSAESVKPRWSWKKRILVGLGVFLLYWLLYGFNHSPIYMVKPFEGVMIDSETKKPIEGMVVVSIWQTYNFWLDRPYRVVKVDEALTDKDGKFHVKGSLPFLRLPFTYFNRLSNTIYIYKHGYKPSLLYGSVDLDRVKEDYGDISKLTSKEMDYITRYVVITNDKYEQRGFLRDIAWSGRVLERYRYDFESFEDKDYKKMGNGAQSVEKSVSDVDYPGGYRKFKLTKMAEELQKTYILLNKNYKNKDYNYILGLDAQLILKKGIDNEE